MELPYNEGLREWPKLFPINRFLNIEVIFHIFTITGVPEKKNHSLYRGLRYIEVTRYIEVPQPASVKRDGVWKLKFNFAACFPYAEVHIYVIIACDKRGFFVINTMFIFRYFSNDVLLFVSTSVIVCIRVYA